MVGENGVLRSPRRPRSVTKSMGHDSGSKNTFAFRISFSAPGMMAARPRAEPNPQAAGYLLQYQEIMTWALPLGYNPLLRVGLTHTLGP